jgi:hypothetical protein
MLKHADKALYKGKEAGSNTYRIRDSKEGLCMPPALFDEILENYYIDGSFFLFPDDYIHYYVFLA